MGGGIGRQTHVAAGVHLIFPSEGPHLKSAVLLLVYLTQTMTLRKNEGESI